MKCQKSIGSNVKCQKSIRLILTEHTSGVPPVIFSSDRSSCTDDGLLYIYPQHQLFQILSIYAFLYCYKCHSKSLKQYQCNWCHKMLGISWGYLWDIFGISLTYLWDIFEISLGYLGDILWICSGYL